MKDENTGYVYILTNPSFREDWVKIGMTEDVNRRIQQLDTTSVPLPFELYAAMRTIKYKQAERLMHRYIERFSNLRVRDNREYFKVTPETAFDIMKEVATVIDDAEILSPTAFIETEAAPTKLPVGESGKWILSFNPKVFQLESCLSDNGHVYFWQFFKFHPGDIVYIYHTLPELAIHQRFIVEEIDVPYNDAVDNINKKYTIGTYDPEPAKKHNRFVKLKADSRTNSEMLSYTHLLENGLKGAIRAAINLANNKELKDYIEENF